jgi:hypothetical protein
MELGSLFDQLEATADGTGNERSTIWIQILEATGKTKAQLSAELEKADIAHAITVRRWIDGTNVPRPAVLRRVRGHLMPASDAFPYIANEPPVEFQGKHVAIWTVKGYLATLQFAKCAFVCKGMMSMHAETENAIRSLVAKTIRASNDLFVYYVVAKGSAASTSFDRMVEYIGRTDDRDILERIGKVVLEEAQDRTGITWSFASPFIIPYKKKHWDLNREINILYEIPVDEVDRTGLAVGRESKESVFVQLPADSAIELWQRLGPMFKDCYYTPASNSGQGLIPIPEEHWKFLTR